MNDTNLNTVKKQELIGIKKYERYAGQVEIELD